MGAASARSFVTDNELIERVQKVAADAPDLSDAQITALRNIILRATTADPHRSADVLTQGGGPHDDCTEE
jgi:hypothetical protein